MRLLKGLLIKISAILILSLLVTPAAAELKSILTDDGKTLISNGTYWIAFDPIGDHIAGDQFFVNGTTNLSTRTNIYFEFFAPSMDCHTKICNGKSPGTDGVALLKTGITPGINTFSFFINSTEFQSNWYVLFVTVISPNNPEEVNAFNPGTIVDSTIFLYPENWRSIYMNSRTTHPDAGYSYWLSVSNTKEYTRPCSDLTGTTNLPPGEILNYSFLDPASGGSSALYQGGIVIPGNKSGINRFVIPVNTSGMHDWVTIIVWNPRYNASVRSDSLSFSTDFRPSPDAQNVSTTCSAPQPPTTPASPLIVIGIWGTLAVVLMAMLLKRFR